VIKRFELGDRVALLEVGSDAHVGLSRAYIVTIASDVDLFLNQFAAYTAVLGRVRRTVYLASTRVRRRSGKSSTASTCACAGTISVSPSA
jgi:hypothetical protein